MSDNDISVNKYLFGTMIGLLFFYGLAGIFREKKSDFKKNMLKDAKPLTEKIMENKISLNGDTVKSERLDTVAYVIPAYKLR
jgi:hypothetical protein